MQETHFLKSLVPLKNESVRMKGSCMRPGDIVAYMAGDINIIMHNTHTLLHQILKRATLLINKMTVDYSYNHTDLLLLASLQSHLCY